MANLLRLQSAILFRLYVAKVARRQQWGSARQCPTIPKVSCIPNCNAVAGSAAAASRTDGRYDRGRHGPLPCRPCPSAIISRVVLLAPRGKGGSHARGWRQEAYGQGWQGHHRGGTGKERLREEDSAGGRPQPVHGDEGSHEEQDGDGEEAHARCEPLGALRVQGRPHEGGRHLPRREKRAHAGDRQAQVRRRERVGVAPLPGRVAAARVAVPDGGPPTYCKVRKKLNVTSRNRYGLLPHHLLHPRALATPRKGKPSSHRIRYPRTTVWRSSTPLPIGWPVLGGYFLPYVQPVAMSIVIFAPSCRHRSAGVSLGRERQRDILNRQGNKYQRQ